MKRSPDPGEPVPAATQLAALPFLSAVAGILSGPDPRLRVTIHRAMSREGEGYLQQVCDYVGPIDKSLRTGAGRMFPSNHGIIGVAYEAGVVARTKHYAEPEALFLDLEADFREVGDSGDPRKSRLSWLAIPFGGKGENSDPVLVLFADTFEFNFFANNQRIDQVIKMCRGFTQLIDTLEDDPFPSLKNFPLRAGKMVRGRNTLYKRVKEELTNIDVPRFQNLTSFNYEASAT